MQPWMLLQYWPSLAPRRTEAFGAGQYVLFLKNVGIPLGFLFPHSCFFGLGKWDGFDFDEGCQEATYFIVSS